MTKIKNPILASMLKRMGVKVTAELVIDDANGTTVTFPDISDVSEIAIDVSTDAPDGTYTMVDGERTITIVVESGKVTAIDIFDPSVEVGGTDEEVMAVLEAVVDANVQANASILALQTELKELKISLKHEGKEPPAAAAEKNKPKFKVIG